MSRNEEAFELGFYDGQNYAIGICFGDKPTIRDFDTPDEDWHYREGFEVGMSTID